MYQEKENFKNTAVLLAGLTLAALASRLVLIPTRLIVENDGPYYIALAERLLAGNWMGALNDYWSQFYPVMIAFLGLFTNDTELAARLVSALCGAALVPAVWLLVHELADSPSANIAALLVVFQPWLIVSSVLPLTEMLFAFLMTMALVFTLRAGRLGGLLNFSLAGFLTALAILTRPEGLLLVISLMAVSTVRLMRYRNRHVVRESVFAFAILLFVMTPQTWGTYRAYGHVNFLWKSSVNVALSETFNNSSKAEQAANSLTSQGNRKLNEAASQSSLGEYWFLHSFSAFQRVWQNIEYFWNGITNDELLPTPYMGLPAFFVGILAGIGIAKGLIKGSRMSTLVFLGFVLAYGFGLFSVLVHPRLLIPLIPFILGFIGIGCVGALQVLQWIFAYFGPKGQLVNRVVHFTSIVGLVLLASSSYLKTNTLLNAFILEPLAQKEAGLWLHNHVAQTTKIISHNPQTPLYFYNDWPFERALSLPWAAPSDVLTYAHSHGVSYIVLEEWLIHEAHYPIEAWLNTDQSVPGLKLVKIFGTAPYQVIIYFCTDQ